MVKMRVGDICKKDGKLTESKRYVSSKGHPDLRIDVCDKHKDATPTDVIEYVVFATKVLYDRDIDKKKARERLARS